ncbi:hypothetical protein A4U53_039860 (plasmid) [Rhizobium ruizarguesonis]|uniref:Uncharacterized protein n=2 Tax=Rhizobium TaxID=379 RepID=A0A179BPM4_RHILE|nr:hypothetical protein [Rhizobium leguminosarum]OAP93737.1 hypothetical protein A4U53_23505 [Rhizobium leguminosarum]
MGASVVKEAFSADVPPQREIEAVLAYHGADARAAIGTLLDDIRHLRRQLALAEGAMSRGMTRGWRPDDRWWADTGGLHLRDPEASEVVDAPAR